MEYNVDADNHSTPKTETREAPIRGLGSFDFLGEKGADGEYIAYDKEHPKFDFYTVGSINSPKKGLASIIMNAEKGDLKWYEHIKDGYLGRLPQCLMDIHLGDSISQVNEKKFSGVDMKPGDDIRQERRRFIAASLGKPVDDELIPLSDQNYIDGWNFVLKANAERPGTYDENVPLRFRELRRITYGRNGVECSFVAEPDMNADPLNIGDKETRDLLIKLGKQDDANNLNIENWMEKLRSYWRMHKYVPLFDGKPTDGIGYPENWDGEISVERNLSRPDFRVGFEHTSRTGVEWAPIGTPEADAYRKYRVKNPNGLDYEEHILGAAKELDVLWDTKARLAMTLRLTEAKLGTGKNGDKLEQQVAFQLPLHVQSGGGQSWQDGDYNKTPTTEYIWLYFEEIDRSPTQGAPHEAKNQRNQEFYKYHSSQICSTYFCVPVAIPMTNPDHVQRNHRNCLSTNWMIPNSLYDDAFIKCANPDDWPKD